MGKISKVHCPNDGGSHPKDSPFHYDPLGHPALCTPEGRRLVRKAQKLLNTRSREIRTAQQFLTAMGVLPADE